MNDIKGLGWPTFDRNDGNGPHLAGFNHNELVCIEEGCNCLLLTSPADHGSYGDISTSETYRLLVASHQLPDLRPVLSSFKNYDRHGPRHDLSAAWWNKIFGSTEYARGQP